jgi:hypothetical protein
LKIAGKHFGDTNFKRILGIISFGCALAAMLVFVIMEEAQTLNGFWASGSVRFFLGVVLCFFPIGQGVAGFLIKNTQSKKNKYWLKVFFGLTLLHLIILIQLAAFLRFPLAFAPLDIAWILYIRKLIKTKRVTVKKIFDQTPINTNAPHIDDAVLTLAINEADENGLTLLMHAALYNDTQTVRQLLKEPGIDVNCQHETTGNTSLGLAAWNGHYECAHMLLLHPDIDITIRNNDGLTAFDLARANGHFALADMLRR